MEDTKSDGIIVLKCEICRCEDAEWILLAQVVWRYAKVNTAINFRIT